MLDNSMSRGLLDFLYRRMFPLYEPLYRGYKSRVDRAERAWVKSHVNSGSVVLDVGANIGVYSSYFASQVGSEGLVYAFEPDPENFAHLEKLVRRKSWIRPLQVAVGSRSESVTLFRSKGFNFDHRTFQGPGDSDTVQVPMVRLDDLVEIGSRPISLLKIDVQGSELSVLRGAEGLLKEHNDATILLEYAPWGLVASGTSPEEFVDYIKCRDYRIYTFGSYPAVIFDGFDKTNDRFWYRNLVLSRHEHSVNLIELS